MLFYAGCHENIRGWCTYQGQPLLTEAWQGGTTFGSNIQKTCSGSEEGKGQTHQRHGETCWPWGFEQMLPPVTGCTLQLLQSRHQYIAFYPGVCPGSRSRTWGGSSVSSRYAEQFWFGHGPSMRWLHPSAALTISMSAFRGFDQCTRLGLVFFCHDSMVLSRVLFVLGLCIDHLGWGVLRHVVQITA